MGLKDNQLEIATQLISFIAIDLAMMSELKTALIYAIWPCFSLAWILACYFGALHHLSPATFYSYMGLMSICGFKSS